MKGVKTRKLVWVGLIVAAVLIVAGVFAWMVAGMSAARSQTQSAASGEVVSRNGIYTLTWKSDSDPIPLNQMHRWTLHLEKEGAGLALDQATINIDGGMPAHGHGLPTQPQVTRALGNGNYLVEGMRFNMPGAWVVNFHIFFGNDFDTATVELNLR